MRENMNLPCVRDRDIFTLSSKWLESSCISHPILDSTFEIFILANAFLRSTVHFGTQWLLSRGVNLVFALEFTLLS